MLEDGLIGEQKLHDLLKKFEFDHFQLDAIGEKNGVYYAFEAKHQARFEAPPFDGHGLPKWQVEHRLKFQEKTGIKTILVIFDKETEETFWQYLDILDKGEKEDTCGNSPRRIYPLESFNTISVRSPYPFSKN